MRQLGMIATVGLVAFLVLGWGISLADAADAPPQDPWGRPPDDMGPGRGPGGPGPGMG
jgi:hypothetical protein